MSKVYDALKLAEEQRASAAVANREALAHPGSLRTTRPQPRLAFLHRWPLGKRGRNAAASIELATLQKINEIGDGIGRLEEAMRRLLKAEEEMRISIEARLRAIEDEQARALSFRDRFKPIAALSVAIVASLIALWFVGR